MLGVGRDLCGSSSPTPLPKQGHIQHAAQDLVQADLEYLQRRRLHNLPGQPLPVLHHPQREEILPHCFGFGCGRQQKHHAAATPPTGVRIRTEINRQKLVGRDKGSLTEQHTNGTVTTAVQMRRKYDTNLHNRPSLPKRTGTVHSRDMSESPPCRPPHRNLA